MRDETTNECHLKGKETTARGPLEDNLGKQRRSCFNTHVQDTTDIGLSKVEAIPRDEQIHQS